MNVCEFECENVYVTECVSVRACENVWEWV